jgi:chromosome segregation ATPase
MKDTVKHGVNGKSVGKWIVIGCLFGVLGTGCVAQKADLQKVHKDLDQQIRQIRVEKKELSKELEAARAAIAKSQKLISAQKADMNKMRSDLAPLNQQIKLLREQDLTKLYGNFEDVEKKISDLKKYFEAHKKSFSTTTGTLQSDIQSIQTTVKSHAERLQTNHVQVTTLAQQIDENNQAINKQLTDFQTAFEQFKNALVEIGTELTTEMQRASSAEAQLSTEISSQVQRLSTEFSTQQQALQSRSDDLSQSIRQLQETLKQSGALLGTRLDEQATHQTELSQQMNFLQDKLKTDTEGLRLFLDHDVKNSMAQLVVDMDAKQRPVLEQIDALQANVEALGIHVQAEATQVQGLTQSVIQLREAQEVMGSLLGKRGDDILQQAGGLSERMNIIESHQATLAQQEKTVATLNQAIQQFQHLKDETQGQIRQMQTASQLTDQLRQSVEQINSRLQNFETHQSGLVGKLDSDAQTTTTHLQEVTNGIQSIAQALKNVSAKLNTRIANQEQQLNRALTTFQSVQGSADAAQTNVRHLNELTETMNQLREVINTIGTKLGERVDKHEDRLGQLAQRVNFLQGTKRKK